MEPLKPPPFAELSNLDSFFQEGQQDYSNNINPDDGIFDKDQWIDLILQFNEVCSTNTKDLIMQSANEILIFLKGRDTVLDGNVLMEPIESTNFFPNLIACFQIRDDELVNKILSLYLRLHLLSSDFAGSQGNIEAFPSIFGIVRQTFSDDSNFFSLNTILLFADLLMTFAQERPDNIILLIQISAFRFIEQLLLNITDIDYMLQLMEKINELCLYSNDHINPQIPFNFLEPIINIFKIIQISAIFVTTETLPNSQTIVAINPTIFPEYQNDIQKIITDVQEKKVGFYFSSHLNNNQQHKLIKFPLIFFENFCRDFYRASILYHNQIPHLCCLFLDPELQLNEVTQKVCIQRALLILLNFFKYASQDDIESFLPCLNIPLIYSYANDEYIPEIFHTAVFILAYLFDYSIEAISVGQEIGFFEKIPDFYETATFDVKYSLWKILITLAASGNRSFVSEFFFNEQIIDILIDADDLSITFPNGTIRDTLKFLAKLFETEQESEIYSQLAPYLNDCE